MRKWLARRRHREAGATSRIDLTLMKAWIDKPSAPEPQETLATPAPLKTRIAREVVVATLAEAGRPMSRHELLEAALGDPKIEASAISRGTLSAQLAAALSETPPRVIRLGRGIYAAAGIAGEREQASAREERARSSG